MKKNLLIILILLLSLFLNLYGIRFGLPTEERAKMSGKIPEERIKKVLAEGRWQRSEFIVPSEKKKIASLTSYFDILRSYHPDEELILKTISHMNPKKFDFDTKNYIYAPFFTYQIGLGIFLGGLFHFFPLKQNIFFYLKNPGEFAKIYLAGRFIVVLLSLLTVLFVYLIGKKLYNEKVGLLSSLFLAVTPLFVIQSHYIKPDIPMVFWVTLSFYFALFIIETKRLKYYILSGVAAGLAMGSKYPGILALIPVIMAHFITQGASFKKTVFPLMAVFSAIFAFFLTSPYILIHFSRFWHDFFWIAGAATSKFPFQFLNSLLYYPVTMFLYIISPLLFLLILFSFFFALKRSTIKERILFSGIVPFIFFLLMSRPSSETYGLPIFPFLAILAGNFFNETILERKMSGLTKSVILLAIVGVAFSYTFSFERIARNTDVRLRTSYWIEKNVPRGAKIGMAKYPVIYRMPSINPDKYIIKVGPWRKCAIRFANNNVITFCFFQSFSDCIAISLFFFFY
ncbi:Undecaprenyl phosphate-alpha-4-amino-4-deoxy-L-arabinose arabinosyl transferase [subsurface metagenome]